jgi:hypothetical protein
MINQAKLFFFFLFFWISYCEKRHVLNENWEWGWTPTYGSMNLRSIIWLPTMKNLSASVIHDELVIMLGFNVISCSIATKYFWQSRVNRIIAKILENLSATVTVGVIQMHINNNHSLRSRSWRSLLSFH